MAYNSKPLKTLPFIISAFIWLVGWILLLIDLAIGSTWNIIAGTLGLRWFILVFSFIVVSSLVVLQFTEKLYSSFGKLFHTSLFIIITCQLMFIKRLGPPRSIKLAIAGLVITTIILSIGKESTPTVDTSVPTSKQDMEMPTVPIKSVESDDTTTQSEDKKMRVRALFSYAKNTNDAKEISFQAGDILEVISNKGNWWQCCKLDTLGNIIEEGYAPSNYLEKIADD
jgi:hypothetical protein